MFLFLFTCIVTIIKMATQGSRYYDSSSKKENLQNNYILQRYLNEKCHLQRDFAPLRGMNDHHYQQNPQHSTGTKLSLPQVSPVSSSTKRPLSATKTTAYLNLTNNNSNNNVNNNEVKVIESLNDDDFLKNNVQIVLNNLSQNFCNALKDFGGSRTKHYQHHQLQLSGNDNFAMSSPESDCNSNPTPLFANTMLPIGCSVASSQDFTHDNSDYQWFLDYGYRDAMQQPQSILSSLSASYSGIGELSYYDDLAKNIDANLAEVDMESFRTEDIHSLLTKLPTMSDKAAAKRSLNDMMDNSICKSELLFSPVKESHISVDSLDMEGFADEADIILTCKANKDNYTIAFEGSAMYSDDSFYDGPEYSHGTKLKQNSINNFNNKLLTTPVPTDTGLNSSLSKSETGAYTTWSKLRQSNSALASHENHEEYHEDDEDEDPETPDPHPHHAMIRRHLPHCFVNKSSSMPNLKAILNNQQQGGSGSSSTATAATAVGSNAISNSSVDSYGNQRALLPHYPMPISTTSDGESPNVAMMHQSSEGSHEPANNVPSFNLVKLFIKQKSSSTDTCMDVSSGCWPSDSSGSDHTNNNNNSNGGSARARKKSMNDSGKGSDRLSRHDEEFDEEEQYDSLDAAPQKQTTNTAVNSPQKRLAATHIKDLHLNIRNQLKHPALYNLYKQNMNNSVNNNLTTATQDVSDASRTSENLTQIFNINKSRETMSKSIQTSMTKSSMKESIRVVPPSFLAKIQEEIKKEETSVLVVYPNYALPDLEFVRSQPRVILSPISYKEPPKNRRPVSLNDIDSIKKRAFNHIVDWQSLWTLLPPEYRKLLKTIPEAQEECMDRSMASQKPIFSMSPPIRQNRGVACDCAYYMTTCSSSGGSSSQPPSSGYRGSSTLLTDSELGANTAADAANLYVYQYETEVPAERPPTGRPKGILRRANTGRTPRGKRSSLYEGAVDTVAEKRRSLQEPYQQNIMEDYITEMDEHESKLIQHNLLPNYPKKRETYEDYRLHCTNKQDVEARLRAEQFLINIPKSELRHYAEVAHLLETEPAPTYNTLKLRNEVSRALSSQRRVYFTKPTAVAPPTVSPSKVRSPVINQRLLKPNELRFTTPPNSPNMSVVTGVVKKVISPTARAAAAAAAAAKDSEKEKQEKIESNRFKRLQIQWELLSKEANQRLETKSGGTTPTGAQKSRIPRPVSYPTSKVPEKNLKSPSRIVPPKKYSGPTPTPTPRTPNKTVAHTTPKKSAVRTPVVRTR